jgi:hypothetical protein
MLPPDRDLERRRPVWEALADLFLDSALDEPAYRFIAGRIVASADGRICERWATLDHLGLRQQLGAA